MVVEAHVDVVRVPRGVDQLAALDGTEVLRAGQGHADRRDELGVRRTQTVNRIHRLLLEQRDWAWGTSSRSSKLVHGGLRYLQMLDFHLVHEALHRLHHRGWARLTSGQGSRTVKYRHLLDVQGDFRPDRATVRHFGQG